MTYGYWGRICRVDLTTKSTVIEHFDESIYRDFIGGCGLGAYVLWKEGGNLIEPLSPENKIIFALGPFQGTRIPGASKWSVISRSPLTKIYADSTAGAAFGIKLKKSGYDALIIQGKAEKPTFLWITEGELQIYDASSLWGKNTYDTYDELFKRFREFRPSIACIGQAGEALIFIANIVVDKSGFAGRCGLGAVMGSKNLKAIAVGGGNKAPQVADNSKLDKVIKYLRNKIGSGDYAHVTRLHGRANAIVPYEEMGNLPVRYWTGDKWKKGAQHIGAPHYTEKLNAKGLSCPHCPVACHRLIDLVDEDKVIRIMGPEYETLGMFGSCLDIDDLSVIASANHMCNLYGMDTISVGGYAGFLIRCYEEGLINNNEVKNKELRWGNGEFLLDLIHQICERRALGGLFDRGIITAAERIGGNAINLAVHVKGLDVPAYDPRAFFSMSINYATGVRGACHVRGFAMACSEGFLLPEIGIKEPCDRFAMSGKEYITAGYQDFCTLCNSLLLCNTMLIAGMSLTEILECLNAITGWDMRIDDMVKTAQRIFTVQRKLNVMYGVTSEDDKIPEVFFEPSQQGGRAGKIPRGFKASLKKYYKLRGWDADGKPTEQILKKFGLQARK